MNATLTSKHVGDNGSKSKVHAMPNSDVDGRKAVCGRSVKWVNANAHGYDHEVTCLACVKVMRAAEATENTDRFIAEGEARLAAAQTVVGNTSECEDCNNFRICEVCPNGRKRVVDCAAFNVGTQDTPDAAHVVESATEGKWDAVLRTTSSAGFNTVPEVGYVGIYQAPAGFNAEEHIHAAGCRDITREMRKFGQSEGDTFPYPAGVTVWNVIEENDGGRASDSYTVGTLEHAQEMVWNANAELWFMPCASIPRGMTPFGPLVMAEDGNYMISEETPDYMPNAADYADSDAYLSGIRNADDTARERGFEVGSQEWLETFNRSYSFMAEENATMRRNAATRAAEDAEALEYDALVDNIMDTLTVDALLSVDVDGIKVSLGWHTFTVKRGDERSIPTIYGEAHGEWNRPTVANWDSIITVEDSKTY